MNPSLDINEKMVKEDHLEEEPKPSKKTKPYEQKKETNIKIKESKIKILPTDILDKMKMNPKEFLTSYEVAKTKYENLFPTFYSITKQKRKQFENPHRIQKININNLKLDKKDPIKRLRNSKTLIKFWQDFFKFLSSLFYNKNDRHRDIRIKSDGFDSIYTRNDLGNYTISSSFWSLPKYAKGRFNQDFHHTYLTPKITCAKGELHLMPIYDDFNGGFFYNEFLKRPIIQAFGPGPGPSPCNITTKSLNTLCDDKMNNPNKFPHNIGGGGWANNYKNDDEKVLWDPELTHDTYERFLNEDYMGELMYRPWVTLRYALNYYADNHATYKNGILIDVNVLSVNNVLSFTLDNGIKLDETNNGWVDTNHSNLLIAHISKQNRDNNKKIIDLYYYENNYEIVFYIKRTLKKLVKLVKKKFEKDKPGFTLDLNIKYMAPSEFKTYNIKTTSMHGFWAVRHGICGEMSRYFGVIWGLLGSYFDNPLKLYLSLQRALYMVEHIKPEHKLVSNFKHALQRMMTVFNHYNETNDPDIYNYIVMSVAKWERDQKYHDNLRTLEKDRPKDVPLKARNDANDFTKPSIKIDANDTSNVVRDPNLFKYHDNLRKFEKDKPKDVPLKARNDANDFTKPSIKIDANDTSNVVRDPILFPPRGGKKNKKTRKHRGIIQTGGNSGKLKKGYRYSGKRLKNGNAEIVKAKTIKRRQL